MVNRLLFLATVVFFCLNVSSQTVRRGSGSLPAKELTSVGRTALDNNGNLELISSASHCWFSFDGKACTVFVSLASWEHHNYLQFTVDGVYHKRVRIAGDSNRSFVISVPKSGPHKVGIFKATEAHTGPVFIQRIEGSNILPVKVPSRPVIEFIGNSITCGAAADASEVPCGTGVYHDQHNAYHAYGPRVARELNVNFVLSSVSGIGIYRNWNSDGPAMPQVYQKSDFQLNGTREWNFKTFRPAIVSIALGTNDYSRGDGRSRRLPFDSTVFVDRYIEFIKSIKKEYGNVQLALLSSAMIKGADRIQFQYCLIAVKKSIDRLFPSHRPVAVYFFKPMNPRGCSGHPSVEDHLILANELKPFFKKLLDGLNKKNS